MKNIINFSVRCALVAMLASSTISCKDALQETLYSELGDQNAFVTQTDALAAVNGIYEPLRFIANRPLGYIFDMPTDVCYMAGMPTETLNQNGLNTQQDVQNLWPRLWNVITRANIVLARVSLIELEKFDTDPVVAEKLKNQYLGEAYGMRAWAYQMLSDIYYLVPLVLDDKTPIEAKLELNSIDEIDAQIIKDLTQAIPMLPDVFAGGQVNAGRITSWAAKGFLMRAHMRRAGRLRLSTGDATSDWTAAAGLADDIIKKGPFTLVRDVWEGLYNPKTNEALYNKEALFAIRALDVAQGNTDLGMNYSPWSFDAGWNLFSVPLEFWWKFAPGDKRAEAWDQWTDATWRGMVITNYPDVYNSPSAKKQTFYVVPTTMAQAGLLSKTEKIGETEIVTTENGAVYTAKYKYTKPLTYNYSTNNNFYILRLADVFLCYAECVNELSGPTAEAIGAINTVRERAFGNQAHALDATQTASKEALRSAICDERAFELHNEGTRRQDLIRMGLWADRMLAHFNDIKKAWEIRENNFVVLNPGKAKPDYSSNWKAYPFDLQEDDARRYYPIPKRESDYNPAYLKNREGMTGPQ